MNCQEAQNRILAERDSASAGADRAALDGHLAQCDACRRIRDDLGAALTVWRIESENVRVPDVEREWHAVRRQIRGGIPAGASATVRRRNFAPWFALPVAAAAALAVALIRPDEKPARSSPGGPPVAAQVARADAVQAPGNGASTMVFVDDRSGWLFVMASDSPPKRG